MTYFLIIATGYSIIITLYIAIHSLSTQSSKSSTTNLSKQQQLIIAFAAITMVIVAGSFFALYTHGINIETNLGQIGDFVGGILNPALSFLALIAILFSISVQEKELSGSISSLKKQEEILRRQSFEGSLFNLLNMLRSRRLEIKPMQRGPHEYSYAEAYLHDIKIRRLELTALSDQEIHSRARDFIQTHSKDCYTNLLQQFVLIYKTIEQTSLSHKDKYHYFQVVKNDFTVAELGVISNLSMGHKKLRLAIRKYWLCNVKEEYLISPFLEPYYTRKKLRWSKKAATPAPADNERETAKS